MKTVLQAVIVLFLLLISVPPGNAKAILAPPATPEPEPFDIWTLPAYELHKQGISFKRWNELFAEEVARLNIPISEDGFQMVDDDTYTEHKGRFIEKDYHYTTYWVMIGGVSVFIRAFEDETITDVYLDVDHHKPIDEDVLNIQLYYFPMIMRACIYASEEGQVTEAEIDLVMDKLCGNVSDAVRNGIIKSSNFLLKWPQYGFYCENEHWGQLIAFYASWL